MSTTDEIRALEDRLVQAELGPDPAFFEEILADDVLIDGQRAKPKIVAAHQPGAHPRFTRVVRRPTSSHLPAPTLSRRG